MHQISSRSGCGMARLRCATAGDARQNQRSPARAGVSPCIFWLLLSAVEGLHQGKKVTKSDAEHSRYQVYCFAPLEQYHDL